MVVCPIICQGNREKKTEVNQMRDQTLINRWIGINKRIL